MTTSAQWPLRKDLRSSIDPRAFRKRLLSWYDRERRDLPWRNTRDPYRVWVSEIMLQQTRVAAVLGHYARFLDRFPTIERLAAAREPSVLAAWSGLGYYRRARMMHAAARKIVNKLEGVFPATARDLLDLPGIGRYTAAAIASIAFGEPVAVVDGNVERVVQRLSAKSLSQREVWAAAEALLSRDRPGDFNQAMMELGATVCVPTKPLCAACPVVRFCATRGRGSSPNAKAKSQLKREICYALSCRNGSVLLLKRPKDASLMPGMWELPEIDTREESSSDLELRHSITITDYRVRVQRTDTLSNSGEWVSTTRVSKLPLTGLARKILRAAEII